MIRRPEMVSDNDPRAGGAFALGLIDSTVTNVVLLEDLFSGSSGVNLLSHTMNVGPGWTSLSNNFTLNGSGQAVPTLSGLCLDVSNAGQSDMDASVTVNASTLSSYASIAVRVQDASNFFHANLDLDQGGLGFFLEEASAGVFTTRASFAISPSAGTNYLLEMRAQGSNFTGFLSGTQAWTYASSDFSTQTKAGIRSNLGTALTFSNFQVLAP